MLMHVHTLSVHVASAWPELFIITIVSPVVASHHGDQIGCQGDRQRDRQDRETGRETGRTGGSP